jgi:uncharacterized protein
MRPLVYLTALALFASNTAHAQNSGSLDIVTTDPKTDSPIVTLTVSGAAETRPDRAMISAGVQTKAVSAADAMAQNSKQMQGVIAALKAQGIAEKDMHSASITLGQDYDYSDGKAPVLKGYTADNSVSVKVVNIAKLGAILDALAKAGATNINGPNFTVEDDSAISESARTKAMAKASNLSAFYAKNAGYTRARLVSISEAQDFGGIQYSQGLMKSVAADGGSAPPVEPGQVSKTINITVKYRLER